MFKLVHRAIKFSPSLCHFLPFSHPGARCFFFGEREKSVKPELSGGARKKKEGKGKQQAEAENFLARRSSAKNSRELVSFVLSGIVEVVRVALAIE